MIAVEMEFGLVEVVFLLCIALCFWKKLWVALGVLVAVIVLANVFVFVAHSPGAGIATALIGVFFAFPLTVYFNLERREKEDRRKSIRRSRRHTGREG